MDPLARISHTSVDMQPKHEHLLYELETTDTSSVGLVIRAIYDGDEHQKFMERLDARIKNHDKDIERMCNYHYQGFIDSIRELLQVRSQAKKLHSEVEQLDKDLQESAKNIVEKGEELVKARKVESNIAAAIENLSLCLPVLTAYSELQKKMKEKRYYPALKTLEQLEHLYLPQVANYRFSHQMRENIPVLRENIKEASMSDLKDFLENIRKFSPKIGEVAMKHTAEQMGSDPGIVGRKKRKAPAPPNPFTGEVDYEPPAESSYDAEEDLSAQDLIDFSPVYRCLHIYTVLGSRDTFETYYRKQRKKQARLVLQPPTNMHETLAGYRAYIHGIVGFFVVEDHVLNTGNGLVNRTYLDEVWNMARSKIINTLKTHSAYCTDAALMLKIKNLIMLFSTTLRNYGYSVNQLFDLLHEIRDHYNEVLMQRWVQVFREILDEESFLPIKVTSQEEYDSVTDSFPFYDQNLQQADFPKRFPFSSMVPKVYQQVKEFIYACLKFSEDLNLSQAEVNDMIRKSTNLLLTRSFSGCLSSLFRKPSLALLQVIQIIIDTGYLEEATVYLEEFVSNITGCGKEAHLSTRASQGTQGQATMFRVARDDAERQICEKLKQKLDEFLELENYDWMLVEPRGHASSFITDLIAFLNSIFQSFTNLPPEVAQVACKSACEHIAKSIMAFMLSDDVKQISMGALQQINLDTIQCEQFAASEPVPGLEEGALLQYFGDLRQLLDLFMSWDWPTYFHDYGQENSKYQRVSPNTAVLLLEKLREADKKNVFSVLKKSERDKKKLLETVLRQLRQLAQTTATATVTGVAASPTMATSAATAASSPAPPVLT
ncbi:exocyst complex component 6B isoform X1 [Schistocerca americana]|uniref:exocyst complex component 6B isoform X1 n=1 Tax=Schistocerca americana TaxID=7009 RepID=UPI001F4F8910|nr:exocyst complex component 6B isoform X1 [Schistocerca americana]XP_047110019.1 exocyst complex component 6B isoform X1 [Schistocerca piceifrons]